MFLITPEDCLGSQAPPSISTANKQYIHSRQVMNFKSPSACFMNFAWICGDKTRGEMTFYHSDRKLFTGFMVAAFTAW
jgi:hypothetical protein